MALVRVRWADVERPPHRTISVTGSSVRRRRRLQDADRLDDRSKHGHGGLVAVMAQCGLSGRRCRSVYRINATRQPVGRLQGGVMRNSRRSRWNIVMCRAAFVLLGSLASACSTSDEGSPRPTPTSPTLPAPPTPPASSGRLQMSGRVLDLNGVPVSGALVEVDYSPAGAGSNPPSTCPPVGGFCWLATRTNDLGEYSVEFEPRTWPGRGFGYVYSFREGYEVDVQWVPTDSSPAVRDLRLRPSRSIPAGESIVVSVDAGARCAQTSRICGSWKVDAKWS